MMATWGLEEPSWEFMSFVDLDTVKIHVLPQQANECILISSHLWPLSEVEMNI